MWRHVRAALVLPGTVTLVIPALLVRNEPWAWPGTDAIGLGRLVVGVLLVGGGLALWGWTVALFARIGDGTLAPWDPTRHLVVAGPYRHVRNPMITSVVAVLLGEAALLGSQAVLLWGLVFFAANAVYLPDITFPERLRVTADLDDALHETEFIVAAVPSHGTREVVRRAAPFVRSGATIVSAAKGIEQDTLFRVSEILEQELGGRRAEEVVGLAVIDEHAVLGIVTLVGSGAAREAEGTDREEGGGKDSSGRAHAHMGEQRLCPDVRNRAPVHSSD